MKNLALIALLASLSACTIMGDKTANNRQWTKVSCIGFADWQVCHDQARKLCPNGYDTRNLQESLVTQNRSMEIACKG